MISAKAGQKIDSSQNEYIVGKNRNNLFLTQTPQAFNFKEIYRLHKTNAAKYRDDDVSLYMNLNKIKFIEGEKNNFKITDQSDFQDLKNIYKSKQSVGIGFDVHRLVPKRKLYLAGLKIKSHLGTLGHSDGDPVLHSITDAILGACKMGDIGQIKEGEFQFGVAQSDWQYHAVNGSSKWEGKQFKGLRAVFSVHNEIGRAHV